MSDISSGTSSSMRSSAGTGGTVTEELFCNKCKIPLANEEKEAHREWHKAIKRQALVGRLRGPQVSGAPTSYERPKTASPRCARPPVKKHVDSPRPPVKGNKASKEEKELPSPSSRPRTRAAAAVGKADGR
ncbi:unnamed protein product [Orchesella dallaii]|uniref:N-acetyltransferase ESCO zinc-finger domain-containing protein n=1 Tax=Orchesella dallaii TaxID=48710 RepID=A0ABP1RN53_9HEXA